MCITVDFNACYLFIPRPNRRCRNFFQVLQNFSHAEQNKSLQKCQSSWLLIAYYSSLFWLLAICFSVVQIEIVLISRLRQSAFQHYHSRLDMPFDHPTGHKVLVSTAPRLKMTFYSTVGIMIFSIAAERSFILSTRDAIMNNNIKS